MVSVRWIAVAVVLLVVSWMTYMVRRLGHLEVVTDGRGTSGVLFVYHQGAPGAGEAAGAGNGASGASGGADGLVLRPRNELTLGAIRGTAATTATTSEGGGGSTGSSGASGPASAPSKPMSLENVRPEIKERLDRVTARTVIPGASETAGTNPAPISPDPEPYIKGYLLRDLSCYVDWEKRRGKSVCFTAEGVACPPSVTPDFLTSAEDGRQWLCTQHQDHFCTVQCSGPEGTIGWQAHSCGKDGSPPCPRVDGLPDTSTPKLHGLRGNQVLPGQDRAESPSSPEAQEPVVNIRGLGCELLEGKEVCFYEDSQGRDKCPQYVNHIWLTRADGQYLCNTKTHYCTVSCQEGNDNVRWHAHEHAWCEKNKGSCPPVPPLIPLRKFQLKNWSEKPRPKRACASADAPTSLDHISVGVLARGTEIETLRDTLRTYEVEGLLGRVGEFIIYINQQSRPMQTFLKPYTDKYGVRVLGDGNNHGIAWGLTWLIGNSTKPYFLFLEKDFKLTSPWSCVAEQLLAGETLLRTGVAHVVRYRSRDKPGRPNWAERMFRGQEEKVFRQQPNLFCNHYYWIADPERTWPDKIWNCLDSDAARVGGFPATAQATATQQEELKRSLTSEWYCSRAEFCNWTNNPFLLEPKWWRAEYVDTRFKTWKNYSPWNDLEFYMNWEAGSWNKEPFIVAQGDGLFTHIDKNNFGI